MAKQYIDTPISCYMEELISSLYELPPYDHKNDTHHELELVFIKPPLVTLANIYNIATLTDSYIQLTATMLTKEGVKIRTRIPLSNIHGLDIKNTQLIDNLTNIIWEKKSVILQKEFAKGMCILRHSIEERHVFSDFKNYSSSIKLEMVNRIRVNIRNIMAEYKIKYFIGSGSQAKSSLLHALNHPKSKPNMTMEIEILSTESYRPRRDEISDELSKLMRLIFMGQPNNVFLYSPYPKMIPNTIMLKKQDITTLDLDELYIVGKTDGVQVNIVIEHTNIYCFFNHLGYGIRYVCNVKKHTTIELVGEAVKNPDENIWTIYVIKVISPCLSSRLDELDYVSKELPKGTCDRIHFKTKQYHGPFVTHTELVESLVDIMNKQPEGVIAFYNKGQKSSTDYKIKKENTIDITINIIFRYMSSEPIIHGDGCTFIEFKTFTNDRGYPKEFGAGKILLSSNVKYLNNIYCILFSGYCDNIGIKTIIVPIKFVGECLHDGTLQKPRMKKTMQYATDSNYYGNQNNVVLSHIQDQKLTIKDIFDLEKLSVVGKAIDDSSRLNQHTTYFTKKRIRGPLGILTNYVKTLQISLYCSKTFMDDTSRRTVLGIDFGNGADFEKYFYGEISLMVATDPDPKAIETGMDRYNRLNAGVKSKYYRLHYIQETIRSKTFIQSIRQVLYFGKANIVDWQLSIHYSFHPRHYSTIMKNLSELTASGGKVLITTMDGDYLSTLTDKKVFIIHKDLPSSENFMSIEKISDEQVLVYSPTTMVRPMAEYIIRKETITRVFGEYGFELIDYVRFSTVINRSRSFIEGISKIESRPSTKNFFELNKNALSACGSLDVYDLLHYYVVYVFSKR
ncbi:mRNA capping enzyme [Sea otter poxvirus]|uniref:mRNA-capping enzyme catalytic subunit n=1 Tax=Sea otter poxvirus TaxID=1416741 RepID=A0A2U9QHS7_9POXV|nr:mRNA capping enzyme [Sea otter poxvirus]AWU47122.1 mRNA capping enzyme [Sea otter poxvirus]